MDAVEYLKMRKRMCKNCLDCGDCPLGSHNVRKHVPCVEFEEAHPEQTVEIVEKWAAEHPVKTRQSELMKLFPNLDRGPLGPCSICPQWFDTRIVCHKDISCMECRRKYWLEEIEEDENGTLDDNEV